MNQVLHAFTETETDRENRKTEIEKERVFLSHPNNVTRFLVLRVISPHMLPINTWLKTHFHSGSASKNSIPRHPGTTLLTETQKHLCISHSSILFFHVFSNTLSFAPSLFLPSSSQMYLVSRLGLETPLIYNHILERTATEYQPIMAVIYQRLTFEMLFVTIFRSPLRAF